VSCVALGACVLTAGCGGGDSSTESAAGTGTTSEAITGPVPGTGCYIDSQLYSKGYGTWEAHGGVGCGAERNESVEICVMWLVTGGWQYVWCTTTPVYHETSTFTSIDFNPRAYSPRWYKTRTWVNADGHTAWLDSDGQYLGTVPE
jgi:hypothetical protein